MLGFAYIDVPVYVVNEKCLFFFQLAFFSGNYVQAKIFIYVAVWCFLWKCLSHGMTDVIKLLCTCVLIFA